MPHCPRASSLTLKFTRVKVDVEVDGVAPLHRAGRTVHPVAAEPRLAASLRTAAATTIHGNGENLVGAIWKICVDFIIASCHGHNRSH